MNVESYSRHGVSTSQAPPMRLLVKYRGIRRIAQRGTVPSALRGRGYDVKNIPIFSSGVLLGGCRLPPLELSTLPRQGLRRWFRTTISGTYGDCAVSSLNRRARGLCWDLKLILSLWCLQDKVLGENSSCLS